MHDHLVFGVSVHGAYLATRDKARVVHNDAADTARASRPTHMVLDFTGVEAMTIGFADEFLATFLRKFAGGDEPPHTVVLYGLNEETRETASVCLERRDLVAAEMTAGTPHLLGATSYLVEAFDLAVRLGNFETKDMCQPLELPVTAISNRVARLARCGALRRERAKMPSGGKKFTYSVPPPWPHPA